MKLASGARLGPYEIVAPIGAGGMGEVYRARDTRLDRTVAIKILPAEFADDAKFRIRFEREAKSISALNHPHICALYDVGPDYLVMEHCEGKTLAQRIAGGPLPLEQVLQYGIEIADALEKAHRQGIIHRDLKPSNVMLTKSGVKLLDFGLAKQHVESSPVDATVQQVTEEGKIVGTIQYMAPELFAAKEADARSDIFALGLVLYEMTTGKPAFTGASKASLIAAILEHEPAPLKPTSPPPLDRLIRSCLAKDPDERIQSAHDVKLQLRAIGETRAEGQITRPQRLLPWTAVLIVALAVGSIEGWRWVSHPRSISRPERLSIALNDAPWIGLFSSELLAMSPDGKQIAYATGDKLQMQVRAIDRFEARALPGIERAHTPFFSPDGKWIGFASGRELRKVPLSGGAPATICEAKDVHGAVWTPDDTIVFASAWGGLQRVNANGGRPSSLTNTGPRGTHRWPAPLPGGKEIMFTALEDGSGNYERAKLEVVSLATGKVTHVMDGATSGRYSPTGHLLFARNGTLFAVPFDVKRLKVTGSVTAVVSSVLTYGPGGLTNYVVGPDGTIVYVPHDPGAEQPPDLVWLDRKGIATPMTISPKLYQAVRFSPDGHRLLFEVGDVQGLQSGIWMYDLERQSSSQVAAQHATNAVWSPDGETIVYSSNADGPPTLFVVPADGSTPPRQLTRSGDRLLANSWSPDGRYIAAVEQFDATGWDVFMIEVATGRAIPFATTANSEVGPVFSPDGHWIAYEEWEFGPGAASRAPSVVVRPFPGPGPKHQVSSSGGGQNPIWIRDEILYNADAIYSVDVKTTPGLILGKPHLLFEKPLLSYGYDVTPDGKRFLTLRDKAPMQADHLNLVRGWWLEGGN